MNLINLGKKFNTKQKCIKHLEQVRWGKKPTCPYCHAKNSIPVKKEFRHHCKSCKRTFSVLIDTIFEGSRMPLPKWFMLISIMLNARKGVSSKQISRDLGITYKTAWYSSMRVRCAMLDEADMLEGIVEMDEVYIGGKPRKRNGKIADNTAALSTVQFEKSKRGRGTKKVSVVGMVERGKQGRVVTKMIENLSSKSLLAMLKKYINEGNAIVMTDEYRGYAKFDEVVQHLTVNHSQKEYVRGTVHTNTIEGYWSIVKNGIRGQYHVLSKKYLPFYLAEFSYKYNRRNNQENAFDETINNAITEESGLVKYKPKKDVKRLVYNRRKPKKAA